MANRWLAWISVGIMLALAGLPAQGAGRLEARVVDAATGQPLAARVAVTDANGRFVEIEGEHPHVEYLKKRWCYVEGGFTLDLPQTDVALEIRRGWETLPVSMVLTGHDLEGDVQRTFRLQRWIDLRTEGYWTGDIHAHLPVPAEAHRQMQAEDLNALTLLYVPDTEDPIAVNAHFTGELDRHSTPSCEMYVGQEILDFQMGHLNLMGLSRLVDGYPRMGGGLEYWRVFPHWDLSRAVAQTRAQEGMVVWAHMSSLPGQQLPVGLALGWLDAIELITWNDPTELPNHWDPWLNSGMSQAEFPVLRGVDLYYQFLNAGFRVPLAAGTDKFFEEIPLGSNRTYARVGEPANYKGWLDGIRAGRSFVSNGPILQFDVEGHGPGDVVSGRDDQRIQARVTARSILPFTTLEIVCNGALIGHKTIALPDPPPADGIYSMTIEATANLDRSAWLAARVVDHPDLRNRILPRHLSVFAHTSPVYFLQEGRPVREEASVAYLRRYVEGFLHWLEARPPFVNEDDRQKARRDAEEALKYYKAL